MSHKYTASPEKETTAIGVGVDLPISTKQSIEICREVRGLKVEKALSYLEEVTKLKAAVKMNRFNKDTGHKPGGIGPGKYPVKACTHILKLIKAVKANAQYKGLGGELVVSTLVAQKGSGQWHYGRQRRRQMKRTTVEVILTASAPAKKVEKKAVPKVEKSVEVKKEKTAEPVKTVSKPVATKVASDKPTEVKPTPKRSETLKTEKTTTVDDKKEPVKVENKTVKTTESKPAEEVKTVSETPKTEEDKQ